MDSIPSGERMKLRRRLRSPEAYEKLREKVKGPEDLERELKRGEALAELHFALETEPGVHDALKAQLEKDLREQGIDAVIEAANISPDIRQTLERGKFALTVSQHPVTHHDVLAVAPEGNVQEKIPVNRSLSDRYASQFLKM